MGHYVTLIRYTQQGASKIKESPARLDAARKAAEAAQHLLAGRLPDGGLHQRDRVIAGLDVDTCTGIGDGGGFRGHGSRTHSQRTSGMTTRWSGHSGTRESVSGAA